MKLIQVIWLYLNASEIMALPKICMIINFKTRVIRLLPEERDNIIEKHAELIRYMIAHTDKQNKKILELAMQPTYDEDRYWTVRTCFP